MAAKNNALISNRVKIVKELANADAVADCLYSDKILTEEMRDNIHQIKEPERKTRELLDTLSRRGDKVVRCLYKAFQETGNETLADCMIDHLKTIEQKENLNEPQSWPPNIDEQKEMEKQSLLTIKDVKSPLLHEYQKEDVYRMQNEQRGTVFIINNTIFEKDTGLKFRKGSDVDCKNMTDLFRDLQFRVVTGENLTAEGIGKFLCEERNKVDWTKMECVVLILMSHGEGSCIFGKDGEPVQLKTLTNIFSNEQCKGLYGKPRLVFVQACRIEGKVQTDQQKQKVCDAKPTPEQKQDTSPDQADAERYKQQNAGTCEQEIKHPSADFLIAFATPEDTLSYRNENTGSWFLCAVMWAFKFHAYREELHHLLIRVNRIVARGKGISGFPEKFTVSEVKSNLRKKLYFFPGVYDNPPRFVQRK